jgi:hypothetical protein
MRSIKRAAEFAKLRRDALTEMAESIPMYAAVQKESDPCYNFSLKVRECYHGDAVQFALYHSVFSVSKFCALVMQKRVSNEPLKEEFRRLRLGAVWRAAHTHHIESFIKWVHQYVMEGADETVVIEGLYALQMKQGETVQEYARRIDVQASKAAAVSNGDYYRALPYILVKGLSTNYNGWSLKSLVVAELKKANLPYLERQIEGNGTEEHWGRVRTVAIETAKNIPVAAVTRTPRDSGWGRTGQPYTSVRQASGSVHSDRAAAASPVGPIGPADPPFGATSRPPFRGNRSNSPFRNPTQRGCFKCGKEGHLQADCPVTRKVLETRDCYNCGKPGHLARNCKEPPGKDMQLLGRFPPRPSETARTYIRRMTVESDIEQASNTEGSGNEEREEGLRSGEEASSASD